MRRWQIWSGATIVVLGSLFWLILAFRITAAAILLALIAAVVIRPIRKRPGVLVGMWLLFFGLTWLPFDITLTSAPDGPKWVGCCPEVPDRYYSYIAARELQRQGKCRYCSDLFSGFEAKSWLIL